MISKDITIENLVNAYPESVSFLSEKSIRCIRCGEPVWGTLESAAIEKGFNADDILKIVNELNQIIFNR